MRSMKENIESIIEFVDNSQGLSGNIKNGEFLILQKTDGKTFSFSPSLVTDVLFRQDAEAHPFLQLNFRNANKVLITDSLVGFKPHQTLGLDMSKLPKVVTTPDLKSVYEAIDEVLGSENIDHELEILKKVYLAILIGGEKVGFNLQNERRWLNRLLGSRVRASA